MGTYLRYLPCIDVPERLDNETDSPVSSTQSRSRTEVIRADHSLLNLPYLPVPTLPSTLEHQVGTVHNPQPPPPPDAPSPRKQYIPGTVSSPSHPIPFSSHPTPAQPTCVHNNPCEIRLGRLGRRQHLARSFRCVGTSTSTCTKGMYTTLPR